MESADASQLGHGDVEHHTSAFASHEETWRAIRDVLELRHKYVASTGIADLRHVLTEEERGELTKGVKDEYEDSVEQRLLQDTDVVKGETEGMNGRPKRKACKDCSCGLAEDLAGGKAITTKSVNSSCGSCYLGDAFRCAS